MTLGTVLNSLFLKPIQLIIEIVYSLAYRLIRNPGLAIVALSLAINFLVLPLYRRADAMQEEERETEARLNKWVTHIKKNFRGDERTMMLQTYYRQNHYSPLYVLRGAASLLLEIPFFIAAYRFLSGLTLLQGVPFGPIADLSRPDSLLTIGSLSVNVLPFVMTGLNFVSAALFTKGQPLKSKIQLYAMALFFLVFLYDSPAGLVFYWTLNNLFSLVKTIFYKLKEPRRVLSVLSALASLPLLFFGVTVYRTRSKRIACAVLVLALCLWIPLLIRQLKKNGRTVKLPERAPDKKVFLLGCLFLAVLTGLLIPSAVIKSSPQEFMDVHYSVHPLWYLAHSFLTASGLFLFWFGVFYWLADRKAKPVFESVIWALCGVAIVNYLFFGTNLGTLTSDLVYEQNLSFSLKKLAFNGIIDLGVFALMVLIHAKWKKAAPRMLAITVSAIFCMSVYNGVGIKQSIDNVDINSVLESKPHFTLSKKGKNVVFIMLDRAIGPLVPYIFHENPALQEQFSGFTYYANTVSFGPKTNTGSPALYGGYEYTPVEINKRDRESLASKQNEALKVMPVLFDANGYDVTVLDPTYAGYQWTPDLSIYDEYPDIHRYNVAGYFLGKDDLESQVNNRNRNFFLFGVMKSSPLLLQKALYDGGQYHQTSANYSLSSQIVKGSHTAAGNYLAFIKAYTTMLNLNTLTQITDSDENCFLMMSNDMTHDVQMLQEPEYAPAAAIDNTEYDNNNRSRFTVDGRTITMESDGQYRHYQANMAAFLQLGKWFEYLKSENMYDNTRIIIASDHGNSLWQFSELLYDFGTDEQRDLEAFSPLLMVKDFNADGFTTSMEFMTNADVPTLATEGVIEDPRNPATGKPINSNEKTAHKQFILSRNTWQTDQNNGNTFMPAQWYSVHDSLWDTDNWELAGDDTIMPAGAAD